jgi:hypothetical protein
MNWTCFLPTKIARSLQQGCCVLFTKFPDQLWSLLTTPTEIAVMLRVLKLCGFDGQGECFESSDVFAARVGINRRTLSKVLLCLEAKQLICVHRQRHQLNRIVLGEVVRQMSHVGKNFPHKENTILYTGEKFSHGKSEIERIHEKWLKKQDTGD